MPPQRTYSVVWSSLAKRELAAIYNGVGSVKKHDVTRAAHLFDQTLRTSQPETVGVADSRWSRYNRNARQYPLRVWFSIDARQGEVVIKKVELDAQPLFPPAGLP